MNIKKLAKFLCGEIPNSKAIPIAEFVNILENNLGIEDDKLVEWKHKSWSIKSDYVALCKHLVSTDEWNWIIGYLLDYFDLPKDFLTPINFSQHIVDSTNNLPGSLQAISTLLDTIDETTFASLIVMPILHAMWYKQIAYKWKVSWTDFWNDFYPMKFVSPGGYTHYTWVQVKSVKMTEWDTSKTWKSTINLIDELKTATTKKHLLTDGDEKRFSEILVINSKQISETAVEKILHHDDLVKHNVIIYDKEWVLSLIEQYNIQFSLNE